MPARIAAALVLAVLLAIVGQVAAQLTERTYLPVVAVPPPTPTIAPTPAPTPTRGPEPEPFFGDCFSNPNPNRAPEFPVRILGIDRGSSFVALRNLSDSEVRLDGWTLCAVGSNAGWDLTGRSIPASGVLQILRPQDPIWIPRPLGAALYDNTGKLIAYYRFQL